jgi:rhodanese-related sulfurtransferase
MASGEGLQSMAVEEARAAVRSEQMVLVDIRTPREWRESGLPDVAVPLDMTSKSFVPALLELRRENPSRRLGLICATGARSRYVANWLVQNGVQGVVDVPAGMHTREGWLAKKLPVRAP